MSICVRYHLPKVLKSNKLTSGAQFLRRSVHIHVWPSLVWYLPNAANPWYTCAPAFLTKKTSHVLVQASPCQTRVRPASQQTTCFKNSLIMSMGRGPFHEGIALCTRPLQSSSSNIVRAVATRPYGCRVSHLEVFDRVRL